MSYEIVKGITFKNNKVFINSADSSIRPLYFNKWEAERLSMLYQENGKAATIQAIAKEVWNGNFRLRKGSKLCNRLIFALQDIRQNRMLSGFLDEDHAAAYMTKVVLHEMKDPNHTVGPSIRDLEPLRHDRETVLTICQKNPGAFNYAAEEITGDRETAKEFIHLCASSVMFHYPQKFADDKELAQMALQQNGCNYRELSRNLQGDRDIVRLAFDATLPRSHHEFLPDLIPEKLRKDIPFMCDLIHNCPPLHFERVPDILANRDVAMALAESAKYFLYEVKYIPKKYLADPKLQNILAARFKDKDPRQWDALQMKFADAGVALAPEGATPQMPLTQRISNAREQSNQSSQESAKTDKSMFSKSMQGGEERI